MAGNATQLLATPAKSHLAPVYLAVVFLLGWYYFSAVSALANKCTTFDELFHLTGGYSYWRLGDFRIQPSNGNLPQRWGAIPLLFRDTKFPNLDQDIWRTSNMAVVGDQFFYDVGNDVDVMLRSGRAMMALFGVALGALIFVCARNLLGLGPAFVSLTLFAFCPTMLANGPLITSDMASALFFFASVLCLWRVMHHIRWFNVLLSSLVMGGLFVAKFSAFLILPIGAILFAIQAASSRSITVSGKSQSWVVEERHTRILLHLLTFGVHIIVVWIVIWAFYDFRYDMFSEKSYQFDAAGQMIAVDQPAFLWNDLLSEPTAVEQGILAARAAHLLPEAYLYGLAHTWRFAQHRSAFLNGQYSRDGWPTFFPYSFSVKTPITLLVLIALSAGWLVRSWFQAGGNWSARRIAATNSMYRTAPLWALFLVYWASAITSHLNIGHRHLLPIYPELLVFAGASWYWTARRFSSALTGNNSTVFDRSAKSDAPASGRQRREPLLAIVVVACIASFVGESIFQWPNYLTYFNQFAGGHTQGYRHLVDSSLDWGQDLPALKQWLVATGLDDSPTEKTYLSYFGTGLPKHYGIKAELLPCLFQREPPQIPEPLSPGTYLISATMLQNVYSDFPGHWNQEYEAKYRQLIAHVNRFIAADHDAREKLIAAEGEPYWSQIFEAYAQARLARLTSFLRQREPEAQINNSILVYRLGQDDLRQALDESRIE